MSTNGKLARKHASSSSLHLLSVLRSRLDGTPFTETSEEIRGILVSILILLVRAGERRSDLRSQLDLEAASSWQTVDIEDPYPLEGDGLQTVEHSQAEREDSAGSVPRWDVDDFVDELAQCVTQALSDHDPTNKQLACQLAVLLGDHLSHRALSKACLPL
ncbi:heat repeat-containing protein [Cystoisospora suis]|uniref:Heat repeat-containing protein n=1 Tax=Cystoisospora suis TaxID=483139 RepID=A0A2C6KIP7_9APIC|nr:heat repeat-containing protein [Cystoisospora suis]